MMVAIDCLFDEFWNHPEDTIADVCEDAFRENKQMKACPHSGP